MVARPLWLAGRFLSRQAGRQVPCGSRRAHACQSPARIAPQDKGCDAKIASGGGRMGVTMDRCERCAALRCAGSAALLWLRSILCDSLGLADACSHAWVWAAALCVCRGWGPGLLLPGEGRGAAAAGGGAWGCHCRGRGPQVPMCPMRPRAHRRGRLEHREEGLVRARAGRGAQQVQGRAHRGQDPAGKPPAAVFPAACTHACMRVGAGPAPPSAPACWVASSPTVLPVHVRETLRLSNAPLRRTQPTRRRTTARSLCRTSGWIRLSSWARTTPPWAPWRMVSAAAGAAGPPTHHHHHHLPPHGLAHARGRLPPYITCAGAHAHAHACSAAMRSAS